LLFEELTTILFALSEAKVSLAPSGRVS